jgi:hypothetical protein
MKTKGAVGESTVLLLSSSLAMVKELSPLQTSEHDEYREKTIFSKQNISRIFYYQLANYRQDNVGFPKTILHMFFVVEDSVC